MRVGLGRALIFLGISAAFASAQVETSGRAVESAVGGNSALAGAALNSAPAPISLTVAPLSAAPMLAAPSAAAAPALAAAPAAAPALAAAPSIAPALAPALAAPAALPAAAASFQKSAVGATPAHGSAASPSSDENADAAAGRELFDAAAPAKTDDAGLWSKLKGWAGLGDRVPEWPGKAGDKIRVGGRSFTLGAPLAEGVWQTAQREWVVQLAPPGKPAGGEAALLRALDGTEIPHARLIASSADGRALVKEFILGDDAGKLMTQGFEARHEQGWTELAARLIQAGATADLSPKNLIWQHWRTRWVLLDSRAVRRASPGEIVAGLLTPEARRAGVDAGLFLGGLRGRLGPDSAEWRRTLAGLSASDREALDARDRTLPAAPELVFGPAAKAPPFPDKAGTPADAVKAVGFDPLTAKPRRMLHADDPGKLNTQVFSVESSGKPRVAVKIAESRIIRRELAMRRVIRRWFGRWFDEPSAFGVLNDRDSYLVMEMKEGTAAHYGSAMTREQRAAMAVLANAFGMFDVNTGNVLYPSGGRPVLLDFEQSLGRRRPVASRLPDEGIALEMPWVDRFELNRAEDYQPAVRAWRELLARPASQAALREDFLASGYSAEEAAALVELVKRNTADLDWTIQLDVEFANQFAARRVAPGARQ